MLLTLAQLLSSPFPGPARSTTLTQTPVTTGSSHWPKPSFLAEDRDPGSLPQSETRQSQPADGTARGPRRGQGPRADTECKAWAVDRPGPESALPLASCLAAGKSGNLAEATSHLRAGVKTGRRAHPTVLPAPRERSESQTHRVSLSLAWGCGGAAALEEAQVALTGAVRPRHSQVPTERSPPFPGRRRSVH